MRKILFVSFLAIMVSVASYALAQPAPGWSMYHNGVQGMGYSANPSTIAGWNNPRPLWKVNAAGGVWGSPIEDLRNGAVVVGTNAAPELYVLGKPAGAHLFGSPIPLTGGWTDGTGVIDTQSTNYVIGAQGGAGSLDAFNTAAGYAPAWTDAASGGLSTKLTTWDGIVYSVASPAGGPGPGVYMWNAAVGNSPPVLHTLLPAGQTVDVWQGFLSMDSTGTFLYYKDNGAGANETSQLHQINLAAGGIVWSTPPHGEGWGNTPTLVDSMGNIYAGFQDVDAVGASTLEKYSPAGVLLWQTAFNGGGAWWHGGMALDPTEQFIYTQTRGGPAGALNPMGGISQFDTLTGVWNWSVHNQPAIDPGNTIGDGFGSPVVDGAGFIYSVDANGTFSEIDPLGNIIFAVDGHHTSSWGSPMITAEGTVVTIGDGGNIVAWTVPEPGTMALMGLGLLGILSRFRKRK